MNKLSIGCHVSIAGGIWNAPKNAADLGCETFQIFTRSPQGGPAPELNDLRIERFKDEMQKYFPLPNPLSSTMSSEPNGHKGEGIKHNSSPLMGEARWGCDFVVHCPYYINFGSGKPQTYHSSISIVRGELERASLLGAAYVMFHTGSGKDLGKAKAIKQAQEGLKKVLDGYSGTSKLLIEIAAGAGEILGDTFEELAEIMEPIKKHKGFGGICLDSQHMFASGYDIRKNDWITEFDKAIGLKWLKMSHINDSKVELGARKDRHEHIGEGMIGKKGLEEFIKQLNAEFRMQNAELNPFPLILETDHDKVKIDIKNLKNIRNKIL